MFDAPLIRDTLVIDDRTKYFYDNFEGDGSVFLLARIVQHAPNYVLKLGTRPLVIIADQYDPRGGSIDGSGFLKNPAPAVAGHDGVDGVHATLRKFGTEWRPVSAGTSGTPGTNGTSGTAGTDVTILCRTATGVNVNVAATQSAPGGKGVPVAAAEMAVPITPMTPVRRSRATTVRAAGKAAQAEPAATGPAAEP